MGLIIVSTQRVVTIQWTNSIHLILSKMQSGREAEAQGSLMICPRSLGVRCPKAGTKINLLVFRSRHFRSSGSSKPLQRFRNHQLTLFIYQSAFVYRIKREIKLVFKSFLIRTSIVSLWVSVDLFQMCLDYLWEMAAFWVRDISGKSCRRRW